MELERALIAGLQFRDYSGQIGLGFRSRVHFLP